MFEIGFLPPHDVVCLEPITRQIQLRKSILQNFKTRAAYLFLKQISADASGDGGGEEISPSPGKEGFRASPRYHLLSGKFMHELEMVGAVRCIGD